MELLGATKTLDVHVKGVRSEIEENRPKHVITVQGLGYKLRL